MPEQTRPDPDQAFIARRIGRTSLMFFYVLIWCCSPIFSNENTIQVKLPVRILASENKSLLEFNNSNIQLLINEKPVLIDSISKYSRTLSDTRAMSRHFYLTFHITKVDQEIESTLSHFLTEILTENDSLHIFTPLKIYRIIVSPNKGAILNDILPILKSDCARFRNAMALCEKNIENEIREISSILNDTLPAIYPYYSLDEFEKSYRKKITEYKSDWLNVYLDQFSKLNELKLANDAEPRIIHFHQQKIFSFLEKVTGLFKSISRSGFFKFFSSLIQLNREIMEPDRPTLDAMCNLILKKNIHYVALYFKQTDKVDPGFLEGLEKICRKSGGLFLPVHSAGKAIQDLKNHREQHVEITFSIPSQDQDLRLRIISGLPGIEPIYRNHYTFQELLECDTRSIPEKIKINDPVIDKNRLSFVIDSYKIHRTKKFALFKIEIRLFDTHQNRIFQTENTFHSTQKKVSLTISIPFSQYGNHKLIVTATDLIANQFSQLETDIFTDVKFPFKIAGPDPYESFKPE